MDGWKDGCIDGCMDGEDLIICTAIWMLYKRCLPLPSAELRVISIASLNKLRSSSLLEGIFKVLGAISGRFGRPKWRPKSIVARFFCNVFFEGVLAFILGHFLEGQTMKNH